MFEELNRERGHYDPAGHARSGRGGAREAHHPHPRRRHRQRRGRLRRVGRRRRRREDGDRRFGMRHQHTFRTATKALSRNIMRAALTTLGIVIGIAAVITMVEIGKGSSTAIKKTIENMGANTLLVMPGQPNSRRHQPGRRQRDEPHARRLRRHRSASAPRSPRPRRSSGRGAQVIYGNQNWQPQQMYGTTPEFLEVRNWTHMAEGECFTDARRPQRRRGLRGRADARARTLPGRVARRQGNPRRTGHVQSRRRPLEKGRQHDGLGPGRHPAGALDLDQVPRDRRERQPRPDRDDHDHHHQHARPDLPDLGRRGDRRPVPGALGLGGRRYARCPCASST